MSRVPLHKKTPPGYAGGAKDTRLRFYDPTETSPENAEGGGLRNQGPASRHAPAPEAKSAASATYRSNNNIFSRYGAGRSSFPFSGRCASLRDATAQHGAQSTGSALSCQISNGQCASPVRGRTAVAKGGGVSPPIDISRGNGRMAASESARPHLTAAYPLPTGAAASASRRAAAAVPPGFRFGPLATGAPACSAACSTPGPLPHPAPQSPISPAGS